jgi:Mg-chelatase subunit ChlD
MLPPIREGVREGLREHLAPDDLVEIISFDSQAVRLVELQPARERVAIAGSISALQPGGGTELGPAVRLATETLRGVSTPRKRVVFITDGYAPSVMPELVQELREAGGTLSTIGFGAMVDRQLLEELARRGGGMFRLAEVDRLREAVVAEIAAAAGH